LKKSVQQGKKGGESEANNVGYAPFSYGEREPAGSENCQLNVD